MYLFNQFRRIPHHLNPSFKYRFFSLSPVSRSKDYYKSLDIKPNATGKEIKSQFYALSMKHHPDKNPDDDEAHAKFLEISEAYSILGNELKRKEYDSSNIGVSGNNSTRTGDPYQRWSSRSYRETLRPDDWILYRRSNKTTRPGFDFAAHRKAHYGETVEEDLNSMKGIRRKYYQEVYEEQGWKHKFIRWGVILFVMGCIFQSEAFGLVFI